MGLWGDGGAAPMTPGRVQGTLPPRARPKAAPVRHAAGGGTARTTTSPSTHRVRRDLNDLKDGKDLKESLGGSAADSRRLGG